MKLTKPQHNAHVRTWLQECVIDIEDVERAAKLSRHIPVVLAFRGVVCGKSVDEAFHWIGFMNGDLDGSDFRNGVIVSDDTPAVLQGATVGGGT